jgi:Sigma-70, region 4
MSRLDELPPDQRATLSLLLRQRKSYAEVAVLLGIEQTAVHDRAHAALAVLAPSQARELAPAQRAEIADYILGQQPGIAERLKTRTYLGSAEPARAWAQALVDELAAIDPAELPDIPPATATATAKAATAGAVAATPRIGESIAELSAAPRGDSDAFGSSTASSQPASSRLGGALLLGAIVVAAVVAAILLTNGGGSPSKSAAKSSTSGTSKTTGPTVSASLPIKSSDPKSRSIGVVEILTEKGKRGFFIAAEHLPASSHFFYAVWLYNSHTSAEPVSKAPPVGSDHKLAGGALLPSNAASYREILLTRETNAHPTHPGHVVLRGPFKLHA